MSAIFMTKVFHKDTQSATEIHKVYDNKKRPDFSGRFQIYRLSTKQSSILSYKINL
jgi:hypothetical protein